MSEGSFQDRQFYNQEQAFLDILAKIKAEHRVDSARIYLTGLSRGGHGTWGLGSRIGDQFAAIAPIAGAIHGLEGYSKLMHLPIWAAHNLEDHLVDYAEAASAVKELEKLTREQFLKIDTPEANKFDYLNHTNIFSTFDRDHHDAWTGMYDRVEIYKWFLKQEKKD